MADRRHFRCHIVNGIGVQPNWINLLLEWTAQSMDLLLDPAEGLFSRVLVFFGHFLYLVAAAEEEQQDHISTFFI